MKLAISLLSLGVLFVTATGGSHAVSPTTQWTGMPESPISAFQHQQSNDHSTSILIAEETCKDSNDDGECDDTSSND